MKSNKCIEWTKTKLNEYHKTQLHTCVLVWKKWGSELMEMKCSKNSAFHEFYLPLLSWMLLPLLVWTTFRFVSGFLSGSSDFISPPVWGNWITFTNTYKNAERKEIWGVDSVRKNRVRWRGNTYCLMSELCWMWKRLGSLASDRHFYYHPLH